MRTCQGLRYRRTGTVYLIVLSCATIVGILGLASLYAMRVQGRMSRVNTDCAAARDCAQSAVDLGMLMMVQDPNWRTTRPNGLWVTNKPLGRGTLSVQVVDPADGTLADSPFEPAVLTGIGTYGVSTHKTQVTLVPDIRPLDALSTCLHASGNVAVIGGKNITVFGAPLSTNTQLDNDGRIDGDAEAVTVDDTGAVTGTLTVPASVKPLPDDGVVNQYIAKATAIPYVSYVDKKVLGPGYNPWGTPNPDGVYYINTGDRDITIKNSRIYGTLIVDAGAHKLTLDNAMFMHPYCADYPVLIVRGKLVIQIDSYSSDLSESYTWTNFNPSGVPYEGQSDLDLWDVYPSEIRGLIHVVGSTELKLTARIKGILLCKGTVTCTDSSHIIHDPGLGANPPQGYTYVAGMKVSPGSFKRIVD